MEAPRHVVEPRALSFLALLSFFTFTLCHLRSTVLIAKEEGDRFAKQLKLILTTTTGWTTYLLLLLNNW